MASRDNKSNEETTVGIAVEAADAAPDGTAVDGGTTTASNRARDSSAPAERNRDEDSAPGYNNDEDPAPGHNNDQDSGEEGDDDNGGDSVEEGEGAHILRDDDEEEDEEEEEEEEDGAHINHAGDQEPQGYVMSFHNNRHVGGAVDLANQLGSNIIRQCSCLSNAVREYYQMPQRDQLQVWDDLTGYQGQKRVFVHGKELPGYQEEFEPREMVEEVLRQLPLELKRMPSSHKHDALDKALEVAPDYVNDRAFLLKFLRAEKFDVYSAAIRMCRHFEAKLELFGPEALGREILLEDLDADDMAAFKTGYIQVLQGTDQSHRPVIFYYKAVSSECYKKRENILRAFWYMANRLSEAERVQKLGVSNVVYNNGGFPRQGMDYEKSRRLSFLFRSVPVRYNTFFVCIDDKPWLTVVETFAVIITRFLRVRLRMLRGTHEQVVDKLEKVGLPAYALPVNEKSELLVGVHLQWIETQRQREETLKKQQEMADLVPESGGATFQAKEMYQEDFLSSLVNQTASFHGQGSFPTIG